MFIFGNIHTFCISTNSEPFVYNDNENSTDIDTDEYIL